MTSARGLYATYTYDAFGHLLFIPLSKMIEGGFSPRRSVMDTVEVVFLIAYTR